ncbi:ankyrin repeat domain-containing protein [Chryseobacterium sp. L7]|uniref:Ankyrin repeat domain-containing protein n=1 Tax=Chryseobacterium endalhagicum TaxID=2797638 RepID=A0ABS1QIK2_9FLAO|nr:ankyrin repeat domain-containing protein [Chryseobacterium endalhagicum]MBL1222391.1 ankyrin repeat domain-containing protein [Chryseobacterium endalhagicum]
MSIHKAAIKEDPTELIEILDRNKEIINEPEKGMLHTALMLAVKMERVESVQLLLDYGADPNLQNIEGRTALHLLPEKQPIAWTSVDHKVKIAELLLQNGADLTITDQFGGQPLWYAVFYVKKTEDIDLVKTYLKYGADPNYNNNGQSALDFAKKIEYVPLIEALENP